MTDFLLRFFCEQLGFLCKMKNHIYLILESRVMGWFVDINIEAN